MGFSELFKSDKRIRKFSRNDIKLQALGNGISGYVELFQSKSDPDFYYAVKTYHCKEIYESKTEYRDRVLCEYNILSKLDHPNIIKVFKYDVSFSGTTVKFYMNAGTSNLSQLIKSIPEHKYNIQEMICIWRQLCEGVNYLHHKDICHRDLKLENLVFDIQHSTLKIIDFATAEQITKTKPYSVGIVGSELYLAPETYSSIKYNGKKADIWSVGIILYYLINRKYPWKSARWSDPTYTAFKQENKVHSVEQIKDGFPDPEFNDSGLEIGKASVLRYLPFTAYELTSQIFESDPEKRIDIGEFYKYEWFNDIKYCHDNETCGINHEQLHREVKQIKSI
ncbi:uncharacterized protein J8A68_005910 [[Candida] subhashii]|uniref:Protein kinase domain-containing protein n=1 Tax=[Candida] subhashii TaxID=561895 RepID=A0A8J5Q1N9_9ASCO|nr:uncharacterized protein J8A68_005910 [[Candida] subhashii]KAG7660644.1 hypothetical protein J8A68_005910 [[Candida] subhashii]